MSFFGFEWCTIVASVILQKLNVCEETGCWVIDENALSQPVCRIF